MEASWELKPYIEAMLMAADRPVTLEALAQSLADLPAGKGRKTAGKRLIGDELSLPGWE